ncbi:MAG: hypothetical protein WD066_11630 [Planctomycetaceae bacterium]
MGAIIPRVAFAGAVLAIAGCGGSAEQEAVRTYLRENLDSGTVEEVRWWEPVPLAGSLRHQHHAWTFRTADANWEPVGLETGKGVRLKYRAGNRAGGTDLEDATFFVANGQVFDVVASVDFRPPGQSMEQYIAEFQADPRHGDEIRRDVQERDWRRAGKKQGAEAFMDELMQAGANPPQK